MTTRIGSLCSGYGGLEMGAQAVLGGTVAWHCEIDRAASVILAHHWPGVPNHGDITAVNWTTVEPIDVLTAGFPCQPVSHAGKRLGDQDERWLWDDVARAVRDLRPGLVYLENVRGLLTAGSGRLFGQVLGDLAHIGYDARWVGVRASDAGAAHGRFRVFVVAYPAGIGSASVTGGIDGEAMVRATTRAGAGVGAGRSAAGVPLVGRSAEIAPADTSGQRHGGREDPRSVGPVDGQDESGARQRKRARPEPVGRGAAAAANADSHGPQGVGRVDTLRRDTDRRGGADIAWGQYEPATPGDVNNADPTEARSDQILRGVRSLDDPQEIRGQSNSRGHGPVSVPAELFAELREHKEGGREGHAPLAGKEASPDVLPRMRDNQGSTRSPQRSGSHEQRRRESHDSLLVLSSTAALARGPREAPGQCGEGGGYGCSAWGQYAAAIHRWEIHLNRLAPSPTDPAPKGGYRLSARAVEFMMGLPTGHVTDVPGISRNDQLKALGNGVVPQQAALALRLLLETTTERAA